MNIVLIGFMGSGKSSVAKHLSELLSFTWVEMDDLVYQKTGTHTMHEVFAKGGELLLRETEIAIAKEYASKNNLVVSTGGGVVLNKIILDYFRGHGAKIFFLHASFEHCAGRLHQDTTRPLFKDLSEAKALYDFRLPLYLKYADATFEVDSLSSLVIAQKIQVSL
jgi:shikimate kinase